MSGECGNVGLLTRAVTWGRSFFNDPEPSLNPRDILNRMNKNKVIGMIEQGKINFTYNSGANDEAMKIIQTALVSLGVLPVDKCQPLWWADAIDGGYGSDTMNAVREFQRIAGISYPNGQTVSGNRIGSQTITMLKIALQAKAEGKDWRAAVKPK